jgi:uncharacterized membrane protein HdeD (DUF308 family)
MSRPVGSTSAGSDPQQFLSTVGRSWLWTLVVGIVTLVAGIMILSWPDETVKIVGIIIGVQLLVIGGVRFVTALSADPDNGSRTPAIILSIVAVLAGVLVLRHPLQTIGLIALIVGAYWLLAGLVTAFSALSTPGLELRWLSFALGMLGVVAGIVVLGFPVESSVALARLLGLWLILIALLELVLAVALKVATSRAEKAVRSGASPL